MGQRTDHDVRAIDLYSGIGGWSLGLSLAGVEVVASYEWWRPAIDTHNGNHGGALDAVDIRKLALSDLPREIDLVVGSPPCTEFSYANRGGGGDLAEGLKDMVKFFEVVEHLKPRFWAMENVPRVAEVLRHGFATPEHALHRFAHLAPWIEVFDFSDYGAPQARRRCIAGNIPLDRIRAYGRMLPRRTLGDVVSALSASEEVVDPVWGVVLPTASLTEDEPEPGLNGEELRMNRDAKAFHPVYNNMAFPDALDEPARTVTATCTRVSRESIIIADPRQAGRFRRLTIRERACLQGFPITYQFYGRSFSEKAKMIGNAVPPTFTYLLALSATGVEPQDFEGFRVASQRLIIPEKTAPFTRPDKEGRTYPEGRNFRAAIPGLRFKSGMRFELSNAMRQGDAEWRMRFFFGSSKDIREVELDGDVEVVLRRSLLANPEFAAFKTAAREAEGLLNGTTPALLQRTWSRRATGLGPYELVDVLGDLASELRKPIEALCGDGPGSEAAAFVVSVADLAEGPPGRLPASSKLARYAAPVLAGMLVGDWFNTREWHGGRAKVAA